MKFLSRNEYENFWGHKRKSLNDEVPLYILNVKKHSKQTLKQVYFSRKRIPQLVSTAVHRLKNQNCDLEQHFYY